MVVDKCISTARQSHCVFSFVGAPGSGKGTLADQCRRELGFQVLSTGNLCRKHVALGTEFGQSLDVLLKAGHLIPDSLITDMVDEWLRQHVPLITTIILDGFPRTCPQAQKFNTLLKNTYSFEFKILVLDIQKEEVVRRLINRRVCLNEDCQAVYSLISLPPKREGVCDYCGSYTSVRNDDTEEIIRERLEVFYQHYDDLMKYYRSINQCINRIDVTYKTSQNVFNEFKQLC